MPQPVDQLPHPAIALLSSRPALFRRQGSVAESWRRRGQKTFGPYYRLSYREDGRQKSVYLGRAGKLVAKVRDMLAGLRQSLRQSQAWQRCRWQVLEKVRENKNRLSTLLGSLGLRMQGFEVRGWRTSPILSLIHI